MLSLRRFPFLSILLVSFIFVQCSPGPQKEASEESVSVREEGVEQADGVGYDQAPERDLEVIRDEPEQPNEAPSNPEIVPKRPASPSSKKAMRKAEESSLLESQLQVYSSFRQEFEQLMARSAWAEAAALQEQAFMDLSLLYLVSDGARLRAQFQLRDLYESAFAFNESDSVKALLENQPDAAESLPQTEPEPFTPPGADANVFLGLIDPDPEELSGTRGVKRVNASHFTIRGYIHAYDGIQSFTINKQPVRIAANALFRHNISLEPGRNSIYLEALSRSGNVFRDTLLLQYEQGEVDLAGEPKQYLLAIALQDYDPDGEWPPLQTPLADARAFTQLATSRYGYEVFDTLYDQRASRRNVVETLKRLRFETHPEDDIIIYYAGHGRYDEEYTMQGYWIFNDSEWSNSDQLAYLNRIPAADILIIADACFAGSFYFEHAPEHLDPGRERARWILASGRLERVQDLLPGREEHSPFAYPLLDFLEGREEPFTAYELGQRISSEVAELTGQRQKPIVRPFSGDTGGEWVFEPLPQRD